MKNGPFDVVSDNDLRAEDWEIAPNAPDRCNILHLFLSSTAEREKDLVLSVSLISTQSSQLPVLLNVKCNNNNKDSQWIYRGFST